jgi:Ras-related GTP-binding protein C/D
MGLRRSGKTSISSVVFAKLSPSESLFLESTTRVYKTDVSSSSFVQFQVWDFPGQLDYFDSAFDSEKIFGDCGAVIFVLDSQDEYAEAMQKLHATLRHVHKVNPKVVLEVFIHKVDGLSDDQRIETQRDIQQKVMDALQDDGLEDIHPSFHLTSIFDHSIFEAMSKVIQKLIPHMDALENLLDLLLSNCAMEKVFLIDVISKIYVATDSAPVDMQTYELCSDMIDVVMDLSTIYGTGDNAEGDVVAYDENSHSVMKLKKPNNNMVLYMREVNKYLALVCVMKEESYNKSGVINYNFRHFKRAMHEVLKNK